MPDWVIAIIVSTLINVAAYIITKKDQKPLERPAFEAPTAEQRPMPVVFGDVLIMAPNVLFVGEKHLRVYKIEVDD